MGRALFRTTLWGLAGAAVFSANPALAQQSENRWILAPGEVDVPLNCGANGTGTMRVRNDPVIYVKCSQSGNTLTIRSWATIEQMNKGETPITVFVYEIDGDYMEGTMTNRGFSPVRTNGIRAGTTGNRRSTRTANSNRNANGGGTSAGVSAYAKGADSNGSRDQSRLTSSVTAETASSGRSRNSTGSWRVAHEDVFCGQYQNEAGTEFCNGRADGTYLLISNAFYEDSSNTIRPHQEWGQRVMRQVNYEDFTPDTASAETKVDAERARSEIISQKRRAFGERFRQVINIQMPNT